MPANFNFYKLHRVIQAAFGWQNSHLHLFSKEGFVSSTWIKVPDESDTMQDDDVRIIDSRLKKLSDVFPANNKFIYLYDFGDNWEHRIKLMDFNTQNTVNATLLSGKGMCPPEDCGGPPGYATMLEALKDPDHPEHDEYREWLGMSDDERFDPAYFDLKTAADAVKQIK